MSELERLVDEYYEAAGLDPRRVAYLRGEILALSTRLGLDRDIGIGAEDAPEDALSKLDNHLCELKELQIRDGLHVFGQAPAGDQLTDLLVALVEGAAGVRARAAMPRCSGRSPPIWAWQASTLWTARWRRPGPARGQLLCKNVGASAWRSHGDTVERLELLARRLIGGHAPPAPEWTATRAVLEQVERRLRPALLESAGGRGPIGVACAGWPLRRAGPERRPDPRPARRAADRAQLLLGGPARSADRGVPGIGAGNRRPWIERYVQEHGDWPRAVALSAWGTANMRTGGDDLAQALALLGARPVWDGPSHRVTGIEILPLSLLDRPRVDVTLRVSGFFRDAFPAQIALFDRAVQEIAGLGRARGAEPHRRAGPDRRAGAAGAGRRN